MIIHYGNTHQVFLDEMLSFIKKHENEINDITFGEDILSMIIIDMKDGDIHGFQLQSERYITHQSLWSGNVDVVPIRATTWTDMMFTRMVCPDVEIVYHPFTVTSAKIHQLPYWVKRTDETRELYLVRKETFQNFSQLFSDVFDFVFVSNDFDISSRVLDIMWNDEVRKYTDPLVSRVDVIPRELYRTTLNCLDVCIKYVHQDGCVNPIIDAMHYIDDDLIPIHTNGMHLKNMVDRLIDKTESIELRMFLIRWKMEHYGFEEEEGLRL